MKATLNNFSYTAFVGGDGFKSPHLETFKGQVIVFRNVEEGRCVAFVLDDRGRKGEFFEIEDGMPKRNGVSSDYDYDGFFKTQSLEFVEELSLTDEKIALALSILEVRRSHEELSVECLKLFSRG